MLVQEEVGLEIVTPADGVTLHVYVLPTLAPAFGGKVVQKEYGTPGTMVVPQAELTMGAA
jgi:hypothetical protein